MGIPDPLLRMGARAALEAEGDCRVVAAEAGASALLAAAERLHPAVALVDRALCARDPRLPGLLALLDPPCRVLILAHRSDTARSSPAPHRVDSPSVSRGAPDASPPRAAAGEMPARVLRDVTPEGLRSAVRALAASGPAAASGTGGEREEPREPGEAPAITPREMEVIARVAEGLSNREIAGRLGIREQTVKNHLGRIMRKLGVSSRLELAVHAVRHLRVHGSSGEGAGPR